MKDINDDKPLPKEEQSFNFISIEDKLLNNNKIISQDEEEDLMVIEDYSILYFEDRNNDEIQDVKIIHEEQKQELKEEDMIIPKFEHSLVLNENHNEQKKVVNVEILEINMINLIIDETENLPHIQKNNIEEEPYEDKYVSYLEQLQQRIDQGEKNVLFDKE